MTNDEISIAIEDLAESSTLLIPATRIRKFCTMANELRMESISYEELMEEFRTLVPDKDSDEWWEFLTSVTTLVFDTIESEDDSLDF